MVDGSIQDKILRSRAELSRHTHGWPILGQTDYGMSENITAWFSESAGALYRREGTPFRNGLETGDLQLLGPGQDDSTTDTFNLSESTITSTIQYILGWSARQQPWSLTNMSRPINDTTYFTAVIGSDPNQQLRYTQDKLGRPMLDSAYFTRLAPLLWNSTNLTNTFEAVAKSLSNHIRDSATSETMRGETLRWTILVSVRWPFLVLPFLTVTASILYVALGIWEA